MHMLYNSEQYAVVQFDIPEAGEATIVTVPETGLVRPARAIDAALQRGGFEIVDKYARREIFLEGALAEQFKEGVQALVERPEPTTEDDLDAYVSGFAALAQQPVVLH